MGSKINLSNLQDFIKKSNIKSITCFDENNLDIGTFDIIHDIKMTEHEYNEFAESCFNENPSDIASIFDQEIADIIKEKYSDKLSEIDRSINLLHCCVGIVEEMGEVMGHIKKHLFHSEPLNLNKIEVELGDKEWYFTNFLTILKIQKDTIRFKNKLKLDKRYPEGRQKGLLVNRDEEGEENYIKSKI